jgi:hypothetical protein
MSVSSADRPCMPRLRLYARTPPIASRKSLNCFPTQSTFDPRAAAPASCAVSIYQRRDARPTIQNQHTSSAIHLEHLRSRSLLLDLSQHALLSLRVVERSGSSMLMTDVKLRRLKEWGISLIATQYRTGSGPGSPAGQPGWGGGSDRMLALNERHGVFLCIS